MAVVLLSSFVTIATKEECKTHLHLIPRREKRDKSFSKSSLLHGSYSWHDFVFRW